VEQFDHGVRDRLAREREEQARENQRCGNGAETVRFSRRNEQAIERWFCEWEVWLAVGRECFARHRRLRPHQRLSLSTNDLDLRD